MKKCIIYSVLTILLLNSCTTKNIIKAYRQTDNNESDQISGIDASSKIQWRIANDNKKLYFKFESSDKSIQRMILFNGFMIVIDTTGGKKEKMMFTVSNHSSSEIPAGPFNQTNHKNFKINSTISFKEAYWKEDENETLIDLQFDKTDFSANYKVDSFDFIVCNATIPLTAITSGGLNALNKLSVALKIEQGKRPQHRRSEDTVSDEDETVNSRGYTGERSGRGSSGGIGMEGGMGRSGVGSGRHGGGRMHGDTNGSSVSPVEFWFTTQLAK